MIEKAIIVSAPSGAGKTTLVRHLTTAFPQLEFSVSACSRQKRENETDGKDYYFITPELFMKKIEKDEFVEWQEVYQGSYYGTLKSELQRIWAKEKIPIFDVDVIGGLNLKNYFGGKALSIFIQPPSLEILETRLKNRRTETEESLQKRLRKTRQELTFASEYDRIVINDSIGKASLETIEMVSAFLLSK
jgi:guanylate kinase